MLLFCICVLVCVDWWLVFFFFKQKTAYEMRISDWSSDVCSSDLGLVLLRSQARPFGRALTEIEKMTERVAERRQRLVFRLGEGCRPFRLSDFSRFQIGRASWRERVCQYV